MEKFIIFRYLSRYKFRVVGILILLILVTMVDAVIPYEFTVLNKYSSITLRLIITLSLSILSLTIVVSAIRFFIDISLKKISNSIMMTLQQETIMDIYKADNRYIERYNKGEIINRLTDDLEAIEQIVAEIMPNTVRSFVFVIAVFAALFIISPIISAISLGMVLLYLFAFSQLNNRIIKRYRSMRGENDKLMNSVEDIVSGMKDIKLWRIQVKLLNIFRTVQEKYYKSSYQLKIWSRGTNNLYKLIKTVANIIVVLSGFYLVSINSIGYGSLFAVILYLNNLYEPVIDLFDALNDYNKCLENIKRMRQFKDDSKKHIICENTTLPEEINSLEFRDISFNYGGEDVLKNISFKLESNKKYLLMGSTGSGKSTLLKLLCGYYNPSSGQILINDKEVSYEQYHSIIPNIYPLMQDSHVFNLTINDLIDLYNEGENRLSIHEKMQKVKLEELIDRLNERVGSNGSSLSGGQCQRLNLTRIYGNARRILIIDEGTSALDSDTEKYVLDKLFSYHKNSMILLCSHNKKMLDYADEVFELNSGKLSIIDRRASSIDMEVVS